MRPHIHPITLAVCLLSAALAHSASVHRQLLVVGANHGGKDRPVLRYAGSDARSFAKVMSELGGVDGAVSLDQPTPEALDRAFESVRTALSRPLPAGDRREIIFYYSGHADEQGILLGNSRYGYQELKRKVESLPAEVRIAILDACESGAITRLKGGQRRDAFLVDASNGMTGTAILTSSSEDESSQESDRLRGSFFTTALVSGLRGAADQTGDGKITLGEAYQFAFHQTLTGTQGTSGGVQHPARDLRMSGTGDVVMTDVRKLSSGLLLPESLEGRLLVSDVHGNLVAEVSKPAGAPMELGLPPGTYQIRLERPAASFIGTVQLSEGVRTPIRQQDLARTKREKTQGRGSSLLSTQDDILLDSARQQPYSFASGIVYNDWKTPDHGMQFSFLVNSSRQAMVGPQISLLVNYSHGPMDGLQITTGVNIERGTIRQGQISSGVNYAEAFEGVQFSAGINWAGQGEGLQAAPININSGTLNGVQAGVVGIIGDTIRGVQANVMNVVSDGGTGVQAGVLNISGDDLERGIQGGVMNIIAGDTKLQGGVLNIAKATGFQAGVLNITGNTRKGQVGIGNIAGHSISGDSLGRGIQGGVMNIIAGDTKLQGGVLNIAKTTGFQAGILNITGNTRKGQVGILNIAGHSDGPTIGILSIVGNGTYNVSASVSEIGLPCLTAQVGTRGWSSQFHYCDDPIDDKLGKGVRMTGFGFVSRIGGAYRYHMDIALDNFFLFRHGRDYGRSTWENNSPINELWRFSILPGARLFHGIGVYAGPSFSLIHASSEGRLLVSPGDSWRWDGNRSDGWAWWPGLQAGIRVGRF